MENKRKKHFQNRTNSSETDEQLNKNREEITSKKLKKKVHSWDKSYCDTHLHISTALICFLLLWIKRHGKLNHLSGLGKSLHLLLNGQRR